MIKLKSLIFLVASLLLDTLQAQTTESNLPDATPKTQRTIWGAVSPKINSLGLYVAPEFQYAGAAGAYAPTMGLSGMFLINQKLALGLTASNSRSFTPSDLNNAGLRMNYRLGGAQIEYTLTPHRIVHVSIPLVLGAGMARVDSARSYSRFGSDFDHHGNDSNSFQGRNNMNNSFFVIQPGLRVEANLSRFAKLYAGVNYRIATGSSSVTYPVGATTSSLTNTQLSGVNFNVGLKLGWFDYKLKKKAQS